MLPWTSAVSERWSQVMPTPVMVPLELVSWGTFGYSQGRGHGCGLTGGKWDMYTANAEYIGSGSVYSASLGTWAAEGSVYTKRNPC